MEREEKAAIVQELSEKFAKAKLAVLADYRGLTVHNLQALRREMRSNNAEVKVAKNTLIKKAIAGTTFAAFESHLQGNTALALTDADPVGPAKVLVKFMKDHPAMSVKSVIFEGKMLTSDDLTALSKLPGINELRAQLLGLMLAVPTGFVRVLNGVPQKAVYLLQAIKDSKESN
ncbi:MAG: 50S ribosomal protein L10 [Thermodesulfobacteriota bacterium]